jgi:hypothetical protein
MTLRFFSIAATALGLAAVTACSAAQDGTPAESTTSALTPATICPVPTCSAAWECSEGSAYVRITCATAPCDVDLEASADATPPWTVLHRFPAGTAIRWSDYDPFFDPYYEGYVEYAVCPVPITGTLCAPLLVDPVAMPDCSPPKKCPVGSRWCDGEGCVPNNGQCS